ncbi:hypothetical protein P3X46_029255 [Hevea brasiliensis]|uniref:Jasmonate O-methyltransferase n=1 Tax=Hevea brasiliensis TaxID=3981 RepID=A0ABQ9KS66_HEVBR|nr:hypothetical protein P3X46_029255 [Hevea brasiliensis]
MTNLYSSIHPKSLAIADLGCSSGPNTLLAVSELIKVVDKLCGKLGRQSPEYQVFLNDLQGNDFNTIFRSLPGFQGRMKKQLEAGTGPFFFTGVPGSFYGRLFPTNSLHFVYSSYSRQWLSKVPNGLEGNKGKIYMAGGSPPSVLKAYYDQFQRDFSSFLTCRSEELVTGGRMSLAILARRSQDPSSKECCYIWELLAMALKEMVFEEGSFSIDRLEVFEINWDAYHNEINLPDAFKDSGYNVAQCMRAVAEPLLIGHFGFGEAIIDDVFRRYKAIIANRMGKEKTEFVNVVVAMTKKG